MPVAISSFANTEGFNASSHGRHGHKHKPDNEHFRRCWHQSNCKDCLEKEDDCSWCPFSWTCVPNPNKIPFLAPAWDPDGICPHWAERWELRARPLGCQVSTITTLTSLVTIACTLFVMGLGFAVVFGVKRVRTLNAEHPRWWKVWRRKGGDRSDEAGDGAEGRASASANAGVDGLISRLRRQKVQDDAAREAILGHAGDETVREAEPLLRARNGESS